MHRGDDPRNAKFFIMQCPILSVADKLQEQA